MDMIKQDLRSLTLNECEALVKSLGWPAFRGRQIFQGVQGKGIEEIASLKGLSLIQREELARIAKITPPLQVSREDNQAGDTCKLLLELHDGERIEMALMLYAPKTTRDRATCCVSTQSGCQMGCAFCATGTFTKCRNLTAGEIVSQALEARKLALEKGFQGLTNLVYMGMGEPLLNLEQVHKSLLILNDPQGLDIGMRRMTISTCGLIPQIAEMAAWRLQVGLAVSLHAPDNALRDELMPVNRKYPIEALLTACRDYHRLTGRRVTYEYALFKGINDGRANARKLGKLLADQDCLINIIPANPVEETGFYSPEVEEISEFINILSSYNLNVQQRESRGQDINAACGQLKRR